MQQGAMIKQILPMNMAQKGIQAKFCILTGNNIQALKMIARKIYIMN